MSLPAVGITGIGSYVPSKVVTNQDLEKMVDTSDEWIITRTGISRRHVVGEGTASSDLGVLAAKRALKSAGRTPGEVDLIVATTASPDLIWPSTACLIQAKLETTKAVAFDVSAACAGFVYALVVAAQFLATRTYKVVLLVGADAMSRFIDWTDRNTCVLFGDGAGAVVLEEVEPGYGLLGSYLGADGKGSHLLNIPGGGSAKPASIETVEERLHFIKMNGNEVFKFATRATIDAAGKALKISGVEEEEVDFLIPHQANQRIIEAAAQRLRVANDKVISNIQEYGNTSTASIPLAIDEIWQAGRIKKGDILLTVGFGAGLTWGANVIRWSKQE
jgi:3-oxoacyl-[acyl-carrier-protein] synthase-3